MEPLKITLVSHDAHCVQFALWSVIGVCTCMGQLRSHNSNRENWLHLFIWVSVETLKAMNIRYKLIWTSKEFITQAVYKYFIYSPHQKALAVISHNRNQAEQTPVKITKKCTQQPTCRSCEHLVLLTYTTGLKCTMKQLYQQVFE